MRFITTKAHGYIDYIMGAFILASPLIFGFNNGGAETWVPVVIGAGGLMYSLCTDYELGAVHSLSMRTHLTLDILTGIVLAASPWIFGFSDYVWSPHLVLGILEIGASLMTKTVPSTERRAHHAQHQHTAMH